MCIKSSYVLLLLEVAEFHLGLETSFLTLDVNNTLSWCFMTVPFYSVVISKTHPAKSGCNGQKRRTSESFRGICLFA